MPDLRSAGSSSEQRFWINTVSLDHVEQAAAGGFTQADHGRPRGSTRPQQRVTNT